MDNLEKLFQCLVSVPIIYMYASLYQCGLLEVDGERCV